MKLCTPRTQLNQYWQIYTAVTLALHSLLEKAKKSLRITPVSRWITSVARIIGGTIIRIVVAPHVVRGSIIRSSVSTVSSPISITVVTSVTTTSTIPIISIIVDTGTITTISAAVTTVAPS